MYDIIIIIILFYRIAADIVENRLKSALLMGADVVINCKTQNLKDRGKFLT